MSRFALPRAILARSVMPWPTGRKASGQFTVSSTGSSSLALAAFFDLLVEGLAFPLAALAVAFFAGFFAAGFFAAFFVAPLPLLAAIRAMASSSVVSAGSRSLGSVALTLPCFT